MRFRERLVIERFHRGFQRGLDMSLDDYRRHLDPEGLGALRTLVHGLPRRAVGLSEPARIVLAERLRDAADLIERGLGTVD